MAKGAARTLQYWIDKGYDPEEAEIMRMSRCPGTFEYFHIFKGMSKEQSMKEKEIYQNNKKNTKSNFIKKYGKEEGIKRWNVYRNKQSKSNTFEYKKEKYGWTREEFDEYNESRSSTKENFINRHGKELGAQLWEEYVNKQSYTNSLEYFIEKYGEGLGNKKYKKYCKLRGHSFESFLERYDGDYDLANKKYLEYVKIRPGYKSSSDLANKMFDEIYENLSDGDLVYYDGLNMEYLFNSTEQSHPYFVDFYIKNKHKVIEFYGDYWHANPEIYELDEIISYPNNIKKTRKDIEEVDNKRINELTTIHGLDILIVWESEYNKDPIKTVKECLEWINGKD